MRSMTGWGRVGRTRSSWRRTSRDIARGLDDRGMEAEAQAEERQADARGRSGCSGDLALDAPETESARDHDAVEILERRPRRAGPRRRRTRSSRSAPAPSTRSRRGGAPRRPTDRRREGSRTCRPGRCAPRRSGCARAAPGRPTRSSRRRGRRDAAWHDVVVESFVVQHQRDLVDGLSASTAETTGFGSTSQNSEIFSLSLVGIGRSERHTMASGWMPMLAQLGDRVLRRLRLQLTGGGR